MAISLILSACSTPSPANQASEDFAVYAAAIKFELKVTSLNGLIVVSASHYIGGDGQSEYLKTQFKGFASPQLVDSFIANNQAEQPLDAIFSGHPEIKLLGPEEFSQIFATPGLEAGWKEFHARYPKAGGTITVSGIGYDSSHQYALVEVGIQSAPLAGVGEFLLLEKINGAWVVQKNLMAWIS